MSILVEFMPTIFVALAFDFILYLTGALVLQIISLGLLKNKIHNHSEFKTLKAKNNKGFIIPYIVGILFYIALIALVAWIS